MGRELKKGDVIEVFILDADVTRNVVPHWERAIFERSTRRLMGPVEIVCTLISNGELRAFTENCVRVPCFPAVAPATLAAQVRAAHLREAADFLDANAPQPDAGGTGPWLQGRIDQSAAGSSALRALADEVEAGSRG